MSNKQDDHTKSASAPAAGIPAIKSSYGLRFTGIVTAVGAKTPWIDNESKKTLGVKSALQVSDGKKGYTYSLKSEAGFDHPELVMFQEITVLEARVMEDMGLARLMGNYER